MRRRCILLLSFRIFYFLFFLFVYFIAAFGENVSDQSSLIERKRSDGGVKLFQFTKSIISLKISKISQFPGKFPGVYNIIQL